MWETMDKYCVGKPLGGLKHLHTTAKNIGDLGAGMHPVMIEFTYVPKAPTKGDQKKAVRTNKQGVPRG